MSKAKGHKKKKFCPVFKPQYIEVAVYDHKDKMHKRVKITKIGYSSYSLQIIGEI